MAEELSREQLAQLRQSLEERRDELVRLVREELARSENPQYVDLANQVHDAEEASVADLLMDLNLSGMERHVQELAEVENALARMEDGSYGYCVDTGEPISYERLKVQPAAQRTIEAQEVYERTHGQSRHPTL